MGQKRDKNLDSYSDFKVGQIIRILVAMSSRHWFVPSFVFCRLERLL